MTYSYSLHYLQKPKEVQGAHNSPPGETLVDEGLDGWVAEGEPSIWMFGMQIVVQCVLAWWPAMWNPKNIWIRNKLDGKGPTKQAWPYCFKIKKAQTVGHCSKLKKVAISKNELSIQPSLFSETKRSVGSPQQPPRENLGGWRVGRTGGWGIAT